MPVKKISEVINSKSNVPAVILCEHAGYLLPNSSDINLGISSKLMASHHAYDSGSKEVTLACAKNLGCTAILGIYSRLWIDLNRDEDSENLIIKKIEDITLPANNKLSSQDIESRLSDYYRPFHAKYNEHLCRIENFSKKKPLIIAIHSFTRKIKEKAKPRPWDISLLHNGNDKTYRLFNEYLSSKYKAELIGNNQPYNLNELPIPSKILADKKNCPHIIIEVCDDKINSYEGILKWSKLISGAIKYRLKN